VFGGSPSEVAAINHGTYFYHAAMEGLLKNDTNIHAGIRTTVSGPSDYENDGYCGFEIVEAREIDTIGMFTRNKPKPKRSYNVFFFRYRWYNQKDSGSRWHREPSVSLY
jgi:hypothetical protein